MSAARRAFILGVVVSFFGIVSSVTPWSSDLEETVGLSWLFALRGKRIPPPEVAVVSIDQPSLEYFELPNKPRKWPRSYHAELVRKLASAGVKVIAFDIEFLEQKNSDEDRNFAEAIREAGNVVLFQKYLKRDLDSDQSYEILKSPIPILADAAAGLGPFSLPEFGTKYQQYNQVVTFISQSQLIPILPVVAFQHYMMDHWPEIRQLLLAVKHALNPEKLDAVFTAAASGNSTALAKQMRELFQDSPGLFPTITKKLDQRNHAEYTSLSSLFQLYAGLRSRYLDFYGEPRSIPTIPYFRLLTDNLDTFPGLHGKAVFVGLSHQFHTGEKRDQFPSPFPDPETGLEMSGVEIAATTFANLLEGRSVRPLEPLLSVIFLALWGLGLSFLFLWLPGVLPVFAAIGVAALGLAGAVHQFALNGIWFPVVVPMLFQLPLALIGALAWQYLVARRERQLARDAIRVYVPDWVVDRVIENRSRVATDSWLVNGICMATDVEHYTRLSERLGLQELLSTLNRYYDALFEPIKSHGGFISDVVGDASLAIWASRQPDLNMRQNACKAAIQVLDSIERFNARADDVVLPTRIGLHCGELLLAHVGAGDHYEYRAVGDVVNASTRIEGLNKQLGTKLLVSSDVIDGVTGAFSRFVGTFRLMGKTQVLELHELVGFCEEQETKTFLLHRAFLKALSQFRDSHWRAAAGGFKRLLDRYGHDGPSLFYLKLCEQYLQTPPPAPWDGNIDQTNK